MKINPNLIENAAHHNPFEDMPEGTKEECQMDAEAIIKENLDPNAVIFRIQDDQSAEWALKKIRQAREEQVKWETFYVERLETVRQKTQETVDYMTGLLQRYFASVPHRVTRGGTEKYALPSGELICKPAGIDYERDEGALLSWCEANLPEAVKVTRKASWAEVKQYMKETGDIPEGVVPVETEPTFQVK